MKNRPGAMKYPDKETEGRLSRGERRWRGQKSPEQHLPFRSYPWARTPAGACVSVGGTTGPQPCCEPLSRGEMAHGGLSGRNPPALVVAPLSPGKTQS